MKIVDSFLDEVVFVCGVCGTDFRWCFVGTSMPMIPASDGEGELFEDFFEVGHSIGAGMPICYECGSMTVMLYKDCVLLDSLIVSYRGTPSSSKPDCYYILTEGPSP